MRAAPKETIEIDRTKLELTAVWELPARNTGRFLLHVWLNGRDCEEGIVHA